MNKKETKEFFKGLKKGQKKFGENIAGIVNSILLTFVYFIGIGLTSIFKSVYYIQKSEVTFVRFEILAIHLKFQKVIIQSDLQNLLVCFTLKNTLNIS